MFFLWLVFTSNLISQTTWLKVKLKLVNFANQGRDSSEEPKFEDQQQTNQPNDLAGG